MTQLRLLPKPARWVMDARAKEIAHRGLADARAALHATKPATEQDKAA